MSDFPVPCICCLDHMSLWEGGPQPRCRRSVGSSKCLRCLRNNKPCHRPSGVVKVRGLSLKKALEENDTARINRAQSLVRKALQTNNIVKQELQDDATDTEDTEEQADLEREELRLEVPVRPADAATRAADAQEQLVLHSAERNVLLRELISCMKKMGENGNRLPLAGNMVVTWKPSTTQGIKPSTSRT